MVAVLNVGPINHFLNQLCIWHKSSLFSKGYYRNTWCTLNYMSTLLSIEQIPWFCSTWLTGVIDMLTISSFPNVFTYHDIVPHGLHVPYTCWQLNRFLSLLTTMLFHIVYRWRRHTGKFVVSCRYLQFLCSTWFTGAVEILTTSSFPFFTYHDFVPHGLQVS